VQITESDNIPSVKNTNNKQYRGFAALSKEHLRTNMELNSANRYTTFALSVHYLWLNCIKKYQKTLKNMPNEEYLI
jgi:hypothetical protein